MAYKIMTGKIWINREHLFTLNERASRRHSLKICKNKRASKLQRCQSFSVLNDWKEWRIRQFDHFFKFRKSDQILHLNPNPILKD